MCKAEIAWRIKQYAQVRLESAGFGLAKPQGYQKINFGKPWLKKIPTNFDVIRYKNAADKILFGRFNVFGLSDVHLGFPPEWNRDPKTGTIAPKQFGPTINYRDLKLVGDIKYIWEINRHLELVTLAQAYHLTKEIKYAEAIKILLISWFNQCPYPMGINWASSLELSVRLVNWAFAWHLVGGKNSPLFLQPNGKILMGKWLRSIYEHCHFISNHFSLYSSANNHFIGENMGLFIGAITWPLWKESASWCETAFLSLEKEAVSQITSDGVNHEQSIWYQHEVTDMLLLCGLIGKENSINFSNRYWKRLESSIEFLGSVMDVGWNMPMIGDSDSGLIVRLAGSPDFCVYRSLLATGTVIFNRSDFKAKAGAFDDKSHWLLGDYGKKKYDCVKSSFESHPAIRNFPKGGYYILGDNFETKKEIKIIADIAPLGYLSIAAHGHADALAFCLFAGGNEFLIDPGTYVYGYSKKWRKYFRGTSAHNTVCIDDQDQSLNCGDFLWMSKANCKVEKWYSNNYEDYISGFHNGYCRLEDPVLHYRSIRFFKNDYLIEVVDNLKCKGRHKIQRFWHFSEFCSVFKKYNNIIAENNGWELKIEVSDKGLSKVIYGNESSFYGWISRNFDKKIKSSTAIYTNEIEGDTILKTIISVQMR
jgi:hypothetical protein